jgi:hypothetical protein
MTADPYSWQTREERKRLAERLYADGWTMDRLQYLPVYVVEFEFNR